MKDMPELERLPMKEQEAKRNRESLAFDVFHFFSMLDHLNLDVLGIKKYWVYDECEKGTYEYDVENFSSVKYDEAHLHIYNKNLDEEYLIKRDELFDFLYAYTLFNGSKKAKTCVSTYYFSHKLKDRSYFSKRSKHSEGKI